MAKVNPGDVFISQLEDGRYIVVRVLRIEGRSWLLNTTPYLGAERPLLTDPVLTKSLSQHRGLYEESPARAWVRDDPPANFERLGNIPAAADEAQTECDTYATWGRSAGLEAWWEWRWLYERKAWDEERRRETEELLL